MMMVLRQSQAAGEEIETAQLTLSFHVFKESFTWQVTIHRPQKQIPTVYIMAIATNTETVGESSSQLKDLSSINVKSVTASLM